jgi:hypothetical protein
MLEIKLSAQEEQAVRETAASMAEVKGISVEQAVKDLLGMGLSSWWQMEQMRQRMEASKARNFNPFAAARGEAQA